MIRHGQPPTAPRWAELLGINRGRRQRRDSLVGWHWQGGYIRTNPLALTGTARAAINAGDPMVDRVCELECEVAELRFALRAEQGRNQRVDSYEVRRLEGQERARKGRSLVLADLKGAGVLI